MIPGPEGWNVSPAVLPAATSSGVVSSAEPMTPTSTPLTELVVAVGRGVHPPRVLYIDGGLVLEQGRVGRRSADVVAAGQQEGRTGQPRCLLVEQGRQPGCASDR
jgi:hypothetical protein